MGSAKHPHDSRRPESPAVKLGIEIYREENNIEPLRSALTPRQRGFAHEYIVDFNQCAAAIRCGYKETAAARMSAYLIKHAGVAAYIDYLQTSAQSKITVVDPDYVISQITQIIGKTGAKDSDKLRGLELIARHLGMFIERQEITGKDGEAIKIEQKTKENVESFKSNLGRLIAINGGKSDGADERAPD